MNTPVPKVYAWDSKARENGVGAEYIIMEKLSGIQLQDVWPRMKIQDRLGIVKSIARHQRAWAAVSFQQLGSLYFSRDLDAVTPHLRYINAQGEMVTDSRFAIGPSAGWTFMEHRRNILEFDRGPCTSYYPTPLRA